MEAFQEVGGGEGFESLPAEPVTVAAYLVYRAAKGLSVSSLSMDRKAISHHHRSAGYPTPTATEEVRQTAAGLRNRATDQGRNNPRQARGLTAKVLEATAKVLEAIKKTAHEPRTGPTGRTETSEFARQRGDVDVAPPPVARGPPSPAPWSLLP